jgi:hypothetical protein
VASSSRLTTWFNKASGKAFCRAASKAAPWNGYFSIFGRGMKDIFQHCSKKHLQRDLKAFDFCYSNRSALGCEDQEPTMRAVMGGVGNRPTYRWPDGKPA